MLFTGFRNFSFNAWLRRNLVLVFSLSLSLFLTLIIIEQSRTIQSQKLLIRMLFQDNVDLTELRLELSRERR